MRADVPGSACFSGLDTDKRLKLGATLRYFGDGHQIAKKIGSKRYWRVPVMDGEFTIEHDTGLMEGTIGGGNILILGAVTPRCSLRRKRPSRPPRWCRA